MCIPCWVTKIPTPARPCPGWGGRQIELTEAEQESTQAATVLASLSRQRLSPALAWGSPCPSAVREFQIPAFHTNYPSGGAGFHVLPQPQCSLSLFVTNCGMKEMCSWFGSAKDQ